MNCNMNKYEEKLDKTYNIQFKTDNPSRKLHLHKQYEIMFILNGKCTLRHENERIELPESCLIILKNTDLHCLIPKYKNGIKRYILYFLPEIVLRYSTPEVDLLGCYFNRDVSFPYVLPLNEDDASEYETLFSELERIYIQDEKMVYGKDMIVELLLCRLVLKINGYYKTYHNINFLPRGKGYTLAYKIIEYIHSHYSENVTVESVAKEFYTNKLNLNNVFKSVCGMTIHQYMINYRLTKAKELLAQGYSVELAGCKVGYQNLSSFSRLFKQNEGISAKQYQRVCLNLDLLTNSHINN